MTFVDDLKKIKRKTYVLNGKELTSEKDIKNVTIAEEIANRFRMQAKEQASFGQNHCNADILYCGWNSLSISLFDRIAITKFTRELLSTDGYTRLSVSRYHATDSDHDPSYYMRISASW